MPWCRPGDKPVFEPKMVSLLTHRCVARPHRVKLNMRYRTLTQVLWLTAILLSQHGWEYKIRQQPNFALTGMVITGSWLMRWIHAPRKPCHIPSTGPAFVYLYIMFTTALCTPWGSRIPLGNAISLEPASKKPIAFNTPSGARFIEISAAILRWYNTSPVYAWYMNK